MEREKVKLVKNQFKKDGWNHKLIFRIKDVVIYSKYKYDNERLCKVTRYEVHKIRLKETSFNETKFERLASENDFGRYGWTHGNYESALNKAFELLHNSGHVKDLEHFHSLSSVDDFMNNNNV